MSFPVISIVWCMLIFCVIYFLKAIYQHMKANGHSVPLPFGSSERNKFISLCNKVQKETKDKKLKLLLIGLNTSYAIAIIFFLYLVFK